MDPIAPWTLDELTARLRAVLEATGAAEDAVKSNGQIAETPNARTIRYYTTIGVLDRPAQAGRVAMYGRRHLEQLVALKRLQARGLVLAEIHQTLGTLDDAQLASLANVPAGVAEAAAHGPARKSESRRERSFWSADASEPSVAVVAPAPTPEPTPEPTPAPVSEGTPAMPVTGLQLSDGVTLAFPAARTINDDDQKALRAALDSVVEIMRARGLLKDPTGE